MTSTNGISNSEFPSLLGDENINGNFYDLNVENQFSISSLGLTNNQFAQLVGIHTDETIQQQIDNIIDITNNVGYFGVFYSTIDQTAASTTAVYNATFNTANSYNNGIVLNDQVGTSGNYNSVKILNDATYNIQCNLHLTSTNANTSEIRAWIRKNGVDIPASCAVQTSHNNASDEFMSFQFIIPLVTNDIISIFWGTNDVSMFLNFTASRSSPFPSPQSPSVFMTIQQVLWYQDNSVALDNLQTEVTDLSSNVYSFENTTNTRLNNLEAIDTATDGRIDALEYKTTAMTYQPSPERTTFSNGLVCATLDANNYIFVGGINIYDIYAPRGLCFTKTESDDRYFSISNGNSLSSAVSAIAATTALNSAAIVVLQGEVATQTTEILALQTQMTAVQDDIVTINTDLTALQDKTQYQTAGVNETSFEGKLNVFYGSDGITIDPAFNRISSYPTQNLVLASSNTLTLDGDQIDVNSTSTINLNSTTGVNIIGTLKSNTIQPQSGSSISINSGSSGVVNIGGSLDIVNINGFPFQSWLWVQW